MVTAPRPLVSVVLPFRNPGPYLAPAIESILEQTFTDFELIAIDDGSRDGSADVLARFADRDRRVRPVVQEAQGFVAALNRGLDLARAPIIGRMDADDLSLPDRLERQLAFLERHPEIAGVGTAYRVFTNKHASWRVSRFPCDPAEIRAELMTRNTFAHPTMLVRREVFDSVGGYRPQFKDAEDYDLWLRMSERFELANLPDVLYLYRWHGSQATFARLEQQTLSALAAVECARRRRAGRPDPADDVQGPVTLEVLGTLGLAPDIVTTKVAETALDAVRALIEEDLIEQAEHLARTIADRVRSGAFGGSDAYVAARLASWHVHRARGRPLRALVELGRCARVAPGRLAVRVGRKLLRTGLT